VDGAGPGFDGVPWFLTSNAGMDPTDPTDDLRRRLTALETKACFADDLLDHLNAQVAAQQDQIDLLLREVRRLRQQQAAGDGSDDASGSFRSLRDELPPHY
jgi:SlyX protein